MDSGFKEPLSEMLVSEALRVNLLPPIPTPCGLANYQMYSFLYSLTILLLELLEPAGAVSLETALVVSDSSSKESRLLLDCDIC